MLSLSEKGKGGKKTTFQMSELHMASSLHDEELQMEQTSQERGGPEWRQIEPRRGWGGEGMRAGGLC